MKCDFEDGFCHWLCDMVSLIRYLLKQVRNWMVMSIVSDKGTVQMDLLGAISWPVSACFGWAEFEDVFPASPCLSAIIQCFLVIIYKCDRLASSSFLICCFIMSIWQLGVQLVRANRNIFRRVNAHYTPFHTRIVTIYATACHPQKQ